DRRHLARARSTRVRRRHAGGERDGSSGAGTTCRPDLQLAGALEVCNSKSSRSPPPTRIREGITPSRCRTTGPTAMNRRRRALFDLNLVTLIDRRHPVARIGAVQVRNADEDPGVVATIRILPFEFEHEIGKRLARVPEQTRATY